MKALKDFGPEQIAPLLELATVAALELMGEALLEAGALDAAEQVLRTAVDRGSTSAITFLAVSSRRDGRLEEALAYAEQAVAAGETGALITLGNVLIDEGRVDEARAAYERAVAAGQVEGYVNLASTWTGEGDLGRQETLYRQGVAGGDRMAMQDLGILLMDSGRLEEALEQFEAAHEQRYFIWFDVGNCRRALTEYDLAAEAYRRGVLCGDVRCHLALADVLADQLGQDDDADSHYLLAIETDDEYAYFNYALFLKERDRADEAEHWFTVAACAGKAEAWHELADYAIGDPIRVRALLTRAVSAGDPDAAQALAELDNGPESRSNPV